MALWLVVNDKQKPRVLLQKWDRPSKTDNLHVPLLSEGWIHQCDNGSELAMVRRKAADLFGEQFLCNNLTTRGYPFPNLFPAGTKEFITKNQKQGIRYHYFGRITKYQLKMIEGQLKGLWRSPFAHTKRIRTITITADGFYRILKLNSEKQGYKDSIFLFPDDFDVIMPYLKNDAKVMKLILVSRVRIPPGVF